jgi:hypothetical protein
MTCSPLKVERRLEGIYRLQIQGRRINQARNQREIRWQAERTVAICSSKRRLTFNGLQSVISQEIELFITIAVKASDLTYILVLSAY